jgi:hypothetical protein
MRTIQKLLGTMLLLLPIAISAQDRLASRNGEISFFSSTPMEDISAVNRKVTSVYVPSTGAIEFAALIKAFEFEKALMQEHFNENYMESNAFPKAVFKGKLIAGAHDDPTKAGTHEVSAEGDLTIHGITQHVREKAQLEVAADGTIKARSDFALKPEDYGITIPGVVRAKIAEQVQVKVRLEYSKL